MNAKQGNPHNATHATPQTTTFSAFFIPYQLISHEFRSLCGAGASEQQKGTKRRDCGGGWKREVFCWCDFV